MLKRFYLWLHRKLSKPSQREEYSGGYWQEKVREKVFYLCREVKGKLADIGCGEGLFLARLAKARPELELWGVDNNSLRLKNAKERCEGLLIRNVRLLLQEAEELAFEDEFFDAITCINVFFNLDSIETVKKVLAQMKRICKKGGIIVFDIRNSFNPLLKLKYGLARYYDDSVKNLPLNTYNQRQIQVILKELGFTVLETETVGGFCPKALAPIIIIKARKE
ncbi:MAG: class I SAM-dependent methyltransferase [Candidatus Omnitrophica bacterium]|nr:class I SAM-dependent methyltransferase [Candidatus Omnitrophota bacterium]